MKLLLKSVFIRQCLNTREYVIQHTAGARREGSRVCVTVMVHGEDGGQGCWKQSVMAKCGEKTPQGVSWVK